MFLKNYFLIFKFLDVSNEIYFNFSNLNRSQAYLILHNNIKQKQMFLTIQR